MTEESSYRDYVADEKFIEGYNAYQRKYAENIRESDKVIVGLVREIVAARGPEAPPARLLDIGCSTGNLLLHLKNLVPGLELLGGDLMEASLEQCRANPDLSGISFARLDMLDLGYEEHFDIIVANAVSCLLAWPEYERALISVSRALKSGGVYISFDWLHPFACQDLIIHETSVAHPEGMKLYFRPMPKVSGCLEKAGLGDVEFRPFVLPIDLPRPPEDGEVITYTVRDSKGERMAFRGTLYQPWCHLIARKSGHEPGQEHD